MRKTLILGSLVATLAPTGMLADEARIPVFQPTTITRPGHYILTRDISVTSGTIISIQSNDVTLDLNGYSLRCSDTTSFLIQIPFGMQNVAVRHGLLEGGTCGVCSPIGSTGSGTRLRVEGVEIRNTATAVGTVTRGKREPSGSRVAPYSANSRAALFTLSVAQ